jgi:hypothetical protein
MAARPPSDVHGFEERAQQAIANAADVSSREADRAR